MRPEFHSSPGRFTILSTTPRSDCRPTPISELSVSKKFSTVTRQARTRSLKRTMSGSSSAGIRVNGCLDDVCGSLSHLSVSVARGVIRGKRNSADSSDVANCANCIEQLAQRQSTRDGKTVCVSLGRVEHIEVDVKVDVVHSLSITRQRLAETIVN